MTTYYLQPCELVENMNYKYVNYIEEARRAKKALKRRQYRQTKKAEKNINKYKAEFPELQLSKNQIEAIKAYELRKETEYIQTMFNKYGATWFTIVESMDEDSEIARKLRKTYYAEYDCFVWDDIEKAIEYERSFLEADETDTECWTEIANDIDIVRLMY